MEAHHANGVLHRNLCIHALMFRACLSMTGPQTNCICKHRVTKQKQSQGRRVAKSQYKPIASASTGSQNKNNRRVAGLQGHNTNQSHLQAQGHKTNKNRCPITNICQCLQKHVRITTLCLRPHAVFICECMLGYRKRTHVCTKSNSRVQVKAWSNSIGQNHKYIYTMHTWYWYYWQGNHQIYGHIRCIFTVLAKPSKDAYTPQNHPHTYTHTHTHTHTHTTRSMVHF